jgi:hypothetical protein
LEGPALYDFVQAFVVGITGLPGNMVRVSYQSEPPNPPDAGTCWAAVTIGDRDAAMFPPVVHSPGVDTLKGQEELKLLCSFFDLGSGGQADFYASLMRDGMQIDENRWVLQLNGWGIGSIGSLVAVPVLLKTRWLYRMDLAILMRREVVRQYTVLDIAVADGTLVVQNPGRAVITEAFATIQPPTES